MSALFCRQALPSRSSMIRAFLVWAGLVGSSVVSGCATPSASAEPLILQGPSAAETPEPEAPLETSRAEGLSSGDPVEAGREPWWADIPPGRYHVLGSGLGEGAWTLALGRSDVHHHSAEGLLNAKVAARLALGAALGREPRDPVLIDLFVSPDRHFFVLYGLPAETSAGESELPPFRPPQSVVAEGPHRVGRHRFHDDRHLFLECEVEGPLANPNWGAEQVIARVSPPQEIP